MVTSIRIHKPYSLYEQHFIAANVMLKEDKLTRCNFNLTRHREGSWYISWRMLQMGHKLQCRSCCFINYLNQRHSQACASVWLFNLQLIIKRLVYLYAYAEYFTNNVIFCLAKTKLYSNVAIFNFQNMS